MSVIRASFLVTFFNVLSLALVFLTNIVAASQFGARSEMDAFSSASAFHLFISGMITSAISFTIIPIFSEFKLKGKRELWRILSNCINLTIILTVLLCGTVLLYSNQIASGLMPGAANQTIQLCAQCLFWIFPSIIALSVCDQLVNASYLEGQFLIPSLCKLINPVLTLCFILLLGKNLSTKSIAFATLIASWFQLLVLWFSFKKANKYSYYFELDVTSTEISKLLRAIAPLLMGMLVYRALPVFDRRLVSNLAEGSVSVLGYAEKSLGFVTTLLVSGLSTAAFSNLASEYVAGNYQSLKNKVERIIVLYAIITLPVTALLAVYSKESIAIVFERGSFSPDVTQRVADILPFLGIILFPSVIGTVLGQCLYVAQRHGLAAGLGVFETILYFVVAIPLVQRFGLKGLVIAKIIDWYIALGLDFYFLQKILVWKLSRLFKTCGKSFFASLLVVGGALVLRSQHAPFVLSVGILGMGYYAVIRSLNLSSDLREFERYFWKQISVVLGRLKKRFKVAG